MGTHLEVLRHVLAVREASQRPHRHREFPRRHVRHVPRERRLHCVAQFRIHLEERCGLPALKPPLGWATFGVPLFRPSRRRCSGGRGRGRGRCTPLGVCRGNVGGVFPRRRRYFGSLSGRWSACRRRVRRRVRCHRVRRQKKTRRCPRRPTVGASPIHLATTGHQPFAVFQPQPTNRRQRPQRVCKVHRVRGGRRPGDRRGRP